MERILVVTMYFNSIISCILILAGLEYSGLIVFFSLSYFIHGVDAILYNKKIKSMIREWDSMLQKVSK